MKTKSSHFSILLLLSVLGYLQPPRLKGSELELVSDVLSLDLSPIVKFRCQIFQFSFEGSCIRFSINSLLLSTLVLSDAEVMEVSKMHLLGDTAGYE